MRSIVRAGKTESGDETIVPEMSSMHLNDG